MCVDAGVYVCVTMQTCSTNMHRGKTEVNKVVTSLRLNRTMFRFHRISVICNEKKINLERTYILFSTDTMRDNSDFGYHVATLHYLHSPFSIIDKNTSTLEYRKIHFKVYCQIRFTNSTLLVTAPVIITV